MRQFVKTALTGFASFTVLAVAPAAFANDTLEIHDFIGSINWSTGPMSIDIEKNAGDTKISGRNNINVIGGVEKIDGSDCKSSYGKYDFEWFGKKKEGRFGGYKNLEDYPILNITVPADTHLIIRNAVVFTAGTPDFGGVDIELDHCGDVTLGDVEKTLALDSRGSADVTVGTTGRIVANLKGSGDLTGSDSGDVLLNSKGSGDVELGAVASLEVSSHGSGDLEVGDVDGSVDLSSHGSGDIEIETVNDSFTYSGHGSGDLAVSSVNGSWLHLKSHGSGDIEVGGGEVERLKIGVSGSADVDFSGETETAELRISGSGDIHVDRVSGVAEIKSSGSGDVDIDERG